VSVAKNRGRIKQPSGVWTETLFENLAASNWQLAVSRTATLCRLGLELGLGLGHPRDTPGSPKRLPCVTPGSPMGRMELLVLFAAKVEKCRVGLGIAGIPPQPGKSGPDWGPRNRRHRASSPKSERQDQTLRGRRSSPRSERQDLTPDSHG
jgi:hypothetical protein